MYEQSVTRFSLVQKGQPTSLIIVPDNAFESVQQAAKELQYHIKQASGAELEIISESNIKATCLNKIFLGNCTELQKKGISTGKFARNGFLIKKDCRNLFMAGNDTAGNWLDGKTSVGTLFAVYEFLDQKIGVRWLWPGKSGEVIPQILDIDIEDLDILVTLPILHSHWRTDSKWLIGNEGWHNLEIRNQFFHDQQVWLRRHRFGSALNCPHAFTEYWRRFGGIHPEYFNMLPDGTRRPDPLYFDGAGDIVSMCAAEPVLWKQIVEDWKSKRTEDNPYLNANENDTFGKCVDRKCMAWDVQGPGLTIPWNKRFEYAKKAFENGEDNWHRHLGSLSDRYAKYYLAVQKLAEEIDPEAVVIGLIYANYSEPPIETKLNERIILRFCPSIMFPWTKKKEQMFYEYWSKWSATGARLFLRPNYTMDGHCFPIFYARKYSKAFSYAMEHGMIATDYDSLTGQYSTQGPSLYMVARNNRYGLRSSEHILEEFYDAFGPAKDAARKYFEFWEQVSDNVTDEMLSNSEVKENTPEGGHWSRFYMVANRIFTSEVMNKGFLIIEQAKNIVEGADIIYRERVAFLEKGLKNAKLTLDMQAARSKGEQTGDMTEYNRTAKELNDYRSRAEGDYIANMGYLAWAEKRKFSWMIV
ncbi:MAG: DUF4838 domain-containing protein [Planctomycetota bacterium]